MICSSYSCVFVFSYYKWIRTQLDIPLCCNQSPPFGTGVFSAYEMIITYQFRCNFIHRWCAMEKSEKSDKLNTQSQVSGTFSCININSTVCFILPFIFACHYCTCYMKIQLVPLFEICMKCQWNSQTTDLKLTTFDGPPPNLVTLTMFDWATRRCGGRNHFSELYNGLRMQWFLLAIGPWSRKKAQSMGK